MQAFSAWERFQRGTPAHREKRERCQGRPRKRICRQKRSDAPARACSGRGKRTPGRHAAGRALRRGRLHPLNQTLREICRVSATWDSRSTAPRKWKQTITTSPSSICRPTIPPGYVGHILHRKRRRFAAHAHLPGSDSHHARTRPEAIRAILPGTTMRYEQLTARSEIEFVQWRCWWSAKVSLRGHEGHLERFCRPHFRQRRPHAPAPFAFPLHRAERRDGRGMLCVRR